MEGQGHHQHRWREKLPRPIVDLIVQVDGKNKVNKNMEALLRVVGVQRESTILQL